ncbi:NIL domain-containing protein [Chloroflexota bacterium]
MAKQRYMLNLPEDLPREPITYTLGQQFNLVTNIIQADIAEGKGWLVLEIDGSNEDIEAGINWAISRGTRVEPIDS